MNIVILSGRLGKDPELKQTHKDGTPYCVLLVATDEPYFSEGERKESTEWHSVMVFGKQGENCAKCLTKGQQVEVRGSLSSYNVDDKKITVIRGEDVRFGQKPKK